MAITNSPRLGIERWSHGTDRHPPRAVWDAQQAILDDLVAIDRQYATLADRPAAGVRGTYCWVEENGVLYRDDGAQWRPIVQFGGGAGAAVVVGGAGSEGTSSRTARADHSHPLPLATASAHGAMRREDKAKLDGATSAATASTLAQRDSAGGAAFSAVTASAAPSTAAHLTRRDYVDGLVGGVHVPTTIPSGANLDAYTTSGVYLQNQHTAAQAGTNYPVPYAGLLTVHASSALVFQEYTATNLNPGLGRNAAWRRTRYNGSWGAWEQSPTARYVDEVAAAALAPVKTTVDNATANATANRLVLRDSAGRFKAAAPSATTDVANKSYVDAVDSKYTSTKSTVDAATNLNTPNTLVQRNATGSVQVNTLLLYGNATGSNYAVPRSYVDDLVDPLNYKSGVRKIVWEYTIPGSKVGTVTLERVGNLVEMTLSGVIRGSTGGGVGRVEFTLLGTSSALPVGFRPTAANTVVGLAGSGEAFMTIASDGTVALSTRNNTTATDGSAHFLVTADPPASFTWGDPV